VRTNAKDQATIDYIDALAVKPDLSPLQAVSFEILLFQFNIINVV
jgi:hypothetical protein